MYSKAEIKSQSAAVRGYLSSVTKKKNLVNALMMSEENLGQVREALSDYSMQFNRFAAASTMLSQMYDLESETER